MSQLIQNIPVATSGDLEKAVANVNTAIQEVNQSLKKLQAIFEFNKQVITRNGINEVSPSAILSNLTLTGVLTYGTYTATPATSSGYVTITDSAGITRKLMVGT